MLNFGGIATSLDQDLLTWYDRHRRILPWRGNVSPYATWVSEIMLQQTRVDTVIPYFHRFMAAFPTIRDLAQADEQDVLKLWEGLGYYSRARNLRRGAIQVMRDFNGELPHTAKMLRTITSIGDYTAGAIASIAFHEKTAAVDGNVIRVITRLACIRENAAIPSVRRLIAAKAQSYMSPQRPGDFNQALMDLGSSICTPGTPDCDHCPLKAHCISFAEGICSDLPNLPQKNPPVEQDWDVLIIYNGQHVLLQQRKESLLKGLWCFPMVSSHESMPKRKQYIREHFGLKCKSIGENSTAKHIFTHRVWQMRLITVRVESSSAAPDGFEWVDSSGLDSLAIPTAVKAARRIALDIIQNNHHTSEGE